MAAKSSSGRIPTPTPEKSAAPEATPLRLRWVLRGCDTAVASRLAAEARISPLAARILASRGMTDAAECAEFMDPKLQHIHDPFLLKGMDTAVERILRAIRDGEAITIYGDYDVDGVSSTTLLKLTLEHLGAKPEYFIPHRLKDGYGISMDALEQIADEGAQVVVTVDTGISAVEEALRARELGIDLVITDHHEPGAHIPQAYSVVNPKQPGCEYPFKSLAGVGVAFKLAHALLKRAHEDKPEQCRDFLKDLMDLVTLGTVADIVPLRGENRVLVYHGLPRLQATRREGLIALMRRASIGTKRPISTTDIGFGLGPRINAAGRTEHAMWGVELMLTQNKREAGQLSDRLEEFNNNRRSIEQKIAAQAIAQAEEFPDDAVLVLADHGWHHGVLGIVASRVLGKKYRPTLVLGIDEDGAKGSARSIAGFDLHAALTHCAELLRQYGGHKMAAGLSLDPELIDAFRERINAYAATVLNEEDLIPMLELDAEATAADLTLEAVRELERLEPFGQDNPKPVVAVREFTLIDDPIMLKERHFKIKLVGPNGEQLTATAWNMADRAEELKGRRGKVELAGSPYINAWNGYQKVELELKDFRFPQP